MGFFNFKTDKMAKTDKTNNIEFHNELTDEKYQSMQAVIVPILLKLLSDLNYLEDEIFVKDKQLTEDKLKLGISKNQVAPGSKELWVEYKERYGDIVTPVCTSNLLKRGYAGSISFPLRYGYINTGCKLYFIMKSQNRAVVEIHFSHGIDMKDQFIFNKINDNWKLNQVKYGYQGEDRWYIDSI